MLLKKFTQRLSDNRKKIFFNIFWAVTGKIVNMAGALFVGILVARYLGPSQYGLMNYVISYVTLFTVISNFGLYDIEIRELSKCPDNRNVILGTSFRLRLFFATLAFLMILITLYFYKTDIFTTYMILGYSLVLYTGCFNIIRNYFTSIVKNEYVVKSEIIRTVVGAGIKVLLLWIKAPLEWFIIDLILFIPMVLTQTITPLLVRVKEKNEIEYEEKKKQFVSIIVWIAILLSVFISLIAYWLIYYTYGLRYLLAVPILQIMAFKTIGMALSSSCGQIIILEKKQKWAFIRNFMGCAICIVLNLILIPRYGVIGSACVTIVTVMFTGCLANIFIPPYYPILKLQLYALFGGWRELSHIKKMIR